MATATATLTNLRIEGQTLAFTLAVTGDAGGFAEAMMVIYDASGTERGRTELGRMEAGQTWEAYPDLPGASLENGDYGAWVYVSVTTADGQSGTSVEQGISFLVGRQQVYPSSEHADKRTFASPPTLSPLRLEGTWVVFDMKNNETYDVEVFHQFAIGVKDSGDQQRFNGQELVRGSATQQGHYLLPENLADGRYLAIVTVQVEGSDFPAAAMAEIQVDGTVLTLMPTT